MISPSGLMKARARIAASWFRRVDEPSRPGVPDASDPIVSADDEPPPVSAEGHGMNRRMLGGCSEGEWSERAASQKATERPAAVTMVRPSGE